MLEFTQQKTGAEVRLPVDLVPHHVDRLAEDARLRAKQDVQALTPLTDERTGRAYTEQRFRDVFGKARAKAAEKDPTVADLQFRWLRNTAVTRLFDSGVAVGDICEVTGHSLNTTDQILDRYRVRAAAGCQERQTKA